VKRTFVDSGVLIRALCGEPADAARAFAVLEDPDREFVSSDVVELEVAAKSIYSKNAGAMAFHQTYFGGLAALDRTDSRSVPEAFAIAKDYGVRGFDAMLVAAAIRLRADDFVTTEKPTKALFRIPSSIVKVVTIHTI
jgi:predicted nucleic acid-binding protein